MIIKLNLLSVINKRLKGLEINLLKKGDGKENSRFEYQSEYVDFKIKKTDKVVDIGSGGYPFPLAKTLVDLYPGKTTHRTEKILKNNKTLIVADICNLPFKNYEFDFSYCSHLLEHVDDPAKACEEIMRVSKRGYIETPTKTSDIMFNFLKIKNHHKWFVVKAENSLMFFEYDPLERIDLGTSSFFNNFHSEYSNPFQELVRNNRNIFNNMFLWKDKFYYFVFDNKGKLLSTNSI